MALENIRPQSLQRVCRVDENYKIVKIVLTHTMIVLLSTEGICEAYSRDPSHHLICAFGDVVKNIEHDARNKRLLIICFDFSEVEEYQLFPSLDCLKTEFVQAGIPYREHHLFQNIQDVDILHSRFMTLKDDFSSLYVYDLKDLTLKFKIPTNERRLLNGGWDGNWHSSCEDCYVIGDNMGDERRVSIYSKDDGHRKNNDEIQLPLFGYDDQDNEIYFVSIYGEKLVVEHSASEGIAIQDIFQGENKRETRVQTSIRPKYLQRSGQFLTAMTGIDEVYVWDGKWEGVEKLRKGPVVRDLQGIEATTYGFSHEFDSLSYITSDEEVFMASTQAEDEGYCNVKFFSISSRECFASITQEALSHLNEEEVWEALSYIIALTYDEERRELFTGTEEGAVYNWTNVTWNPPQK